MDQILMQTFQENWQLDQNLNFHYSVWCKMYKMPEQQLIQLIKDYIVAIGGEENWLKSDIRHQHGEAYWKELGFK